MDAPREAADPPTGAPLSPAQVEEVAALAALAPSVHNTQPWRFVWHGASFEVHEDPGRGLAVLDPEGRERVMSCGAAVQNAELAIRELGYGCAVELLPDPTDVRLLARLTPGAAQPPAAEDSALVRAIPRRYTERGVFTPEPVPEAAVDRMRLAAEYEGAWLRPVVRGDEKIALAVLLSRADAVEAADPAYLEELHRWRTHDRDDEGVPDAAVPDIASAARGSDFRIRDFNAGRGHALDDATSHEPPPPEHPLMLLMGTEGDSREDWVRAGIALGRVLLQATVEDLAVSPMTQVVEVASTRARLRRELGLVGVPQMVLRVGHGQGQITTRRRPVADVLTFRP